MPESSVGWRIGKEVRVSEIIAALAFMLAGVALYYNMDAKIESNAAEAKIERRATAARVDAVEKDVGQLSDSVLDVVKAVQALKEKQAEMGAELRHRGS